jgi:hypothetical protein
VSAATLPAGSAENTRAALHFATAAARVVMRPQLNRVASSKAVIKAMASEIQQLKAKLVSLCPDSALCTLRRQHPAAVCVVWLHALP